MTHMVMTGPIKGKVVLDDGTSVDVTPAVIEVESQERAAQVAHAIGLHWADPTNAHPAMVDVDPDGTTHPRPFIYQPTEG